MKSAFASGVLLLACVLGSTPARADPILVTTATLVTSGAFNCRGLTTCSGENTDSITIRNGDAIATLTFRGVDATFDVYNVQTPVTVGFFDVEASDGFTFPTHPANPRQPILRFNLFARQTLPVDVEGGKGMQFGPGGQAVLPIQFGGDHFSFPSGLDDYPLINYEFNPFPIRINGIGTTALTADVSAVPEPATMTLLGTGLLGLAAARRRRRAAAAQPE